MTIGIHPNVSFYESESDCTFRKECSFPHWKVEEQPNKKPKKGGDKSAVAMVKDVRQLVCVSQDTEPLESSAILRKGTKILGPIRRVRFTRAALRQANIRENKDPTERQERCARGDAWRLAKKTSKLKEKEKATFFSPTDEWGLPAATTIKLEEREFVVDSGASMHMVSRKELNSAELETARVSKSPTTVVTANGGVLTKEEATVYVRELVGFIRDSNAT